MQIKISSRHGHINGEVQHYIEEKAQKLLHLFDRLTMIEVTVDLGTNHEKTVEFVVQAEHKHDIVAREKHDKIQTAVNLALAKVEAQLRHYKEKIQDHRRDPSAGEIAGVPAQPDADEE